jgi:methylated-DNA-[protein]-cysteine S-methyltransferase
MLRKTHTRSDLAFPTLNMQRTAVWQTIIPAPFGKIGIETTHTTVCRLTYLSRDTPEIPAQNALAERVVTQIEAYFDDPTYRFDLPLEERGTPFQKGVWQAIAVIPLGKVSTYAQLAKQLQTGPRAIGQACGTNPFPLLIPCHRVVLSSGGIGGFAKRVDADWQAIKRWLLRHEGALAAGQ